MRKGLGQADLFPHPKAERICQMNLAKTENFWTKIKKQSFKFTANR